MKTALVVEDDFGVRDSVVQALEQDGFKVHAASDGSAALHLLDSIPLPEIIVTDLGMRPMDGRAFIAKVRGNPLLRHISIVVLSGEMDTSDVKELVLAKPFNLDRLLHAVSLAELQPQATPKKKTEGA